MLPKLHKSKELNELTKSSRNKCINITTDIKTDGRPIVAGPVYHTSGISEILHYILEPSLKMIDHIAKDSFDFKDRIETQRNEDVKLSTCDTKSLYTNIRHELFCKNVEYWIDVLKDDLPLLARFTNSFILEGSSIILEYLLLHLF